jgi:hypothetical protein
MSTLLISSLWSGWVSTIVYRLIGIDLGLMGGLIVSMLVMFMINQTSRRLKISVAMIALRIIFDGAQMLSIQFVFEFAALAAMSVPTFIIFFIASSSFSSDVKVSDLRAGMTVYDMINRYKGMYLRIKHTANAQTQSAKGESYIKSGSRLEDSDIYALKNLKRRGKLKFERIGVSDTAPFAPFMFAGAALTIATGGNLFGYFGGFLAFLLKLMGF